MIDLDNVFRFKPSGLKLEAGKLLIAEPFMPDFYFKRAVVLMIEHDLESSLGLVINKKTDYKIQELTADFGMFDAEVYLGGPVQTDSLFILHQRGDLIDDSIELFPGVYWGGHYEQIKEYCRSGVLSKKDIRFYLGYSGWGEHQLEDEMQAKSWLVAPVRQQDVFSYKSEKLWREAVERLGHDYLHWLNIPTNPQWN